MQLGGLQMAAGGGGECKGSQQHSPDQVGEHPGVGVV